MSEAQDNFVVEAKKTKRIQMGDDWGTILSIPRFKIIVVEGKDKGKRAVLDLPIRLGSAGDNDFVLTDATVSRHHAEIVGLDEGFELRDLNSTNGTFVKDVEGGHRRRRPGSANPPRRFAGAVLHHGGQGLRRHEQERTLRPPRGQEPPHAPDLRPRGQDRLQAREHRHRGRDGHGQGDGGPHDPRAQQPQGRALHRLRLLERGQGTHARRALRPRGGRLHGRHPSPGGCLRGGQQGHHLPRRDRRARHRPAAQAAPRPRGARDQTPRLAPTPPRWTCGWSAPPTATSVRWWRKAPSGRTSTIASTW